MTPAVEKILEGLAKRGELRPERVVELARDEASPLHGEFQWDDAVAAERYRLDQARALIRRVRVEVTINNHAIVVPRYVHDPDSDESGGYVSTLSLRTDADRAARVVRDEMQRVLGCLERARAVAAAAGMSEVVEQLLEAALVAREKLKAAA